MELPGSSATPPSPEGASDSPSRRHAEFVQTMLGYICEGLACSPSPPDVDMGSLRAAVSELAWQGMTTGDVHLLHCVQRTCASYGFDTDGSLTIQRWGEELLANTALTTQAMEGLKSEGHQDLASRLSLLSTTQVTLMHRSPRFSEFMGAIMAAASRLPGQQAEGGSGSA